MHGQRGRGRPKKPLEGHMIMKIDPTTELFFKTEDKMGEKIDALDTFKEVISQLFGSRNVYTDYKTYPLYEHLLKFSFK
jgi:hypothetical protein